MEPKKLGQMMQFSRSSYKEKSRISYTKKISLVGQTFFFGMCAMPLANMGSSTRRYQIKLIAVRPFFLTILFQYLISYGGLGGTSHPVYRNFKYEHGTDQRLSSNWYFSIYCRTKAQHSTFKLVSEIIFPQVSCDLINCAPLFSSLDLTMVAKKHNVIQEIFFRLRFRSPYISMGFKAPSVTI